jgi:hypothetical protein
MGHASAPEFLVLHALRLKGFAGTGGVAETAGVSEEEASQRLDAAKEAGLVTYREGRISGWSLTAAGRTRHGELLAAERDGAAYTDPVDNNYRRFLEINGDLLGVCTDWQMRPGPGGQPVINDHSDEEYDRKVIARLRGIDDAVQPVCSELGACAERFSGYGPRLNAAIAKVEGGDVDWFTKPMIDSYHTVWFELHEDLLCTLGIERSKEG